MRRFLTGLLLFLLLVSPAGAQPLSPQQETRIDSVFSSFAGADIPGVAVTIVRNGLPVFTQGYGAANLEYELPVTRQTRFNIGSSSKQFTAYGISLLTTEGRLSPSDEIGASLEGIPDFGRPITIDNLIHHTSGLREIVNALVLAGWDLEDVMSQHQAIDLVRRSRELNFAPGAEFLYCNTGYALLADIIASVTDTTFAAWMKTRVFDPLGMDRTVVRDDRVTILADRADSYGPAADGGFQHILQNQDFVGATNVWTTAEDAAKWLANFQNDALGSQTTVDRVLERGVLSSGDTLSYAWGLMIGQYRGLTLVGHGGADAGYRAYFGFFPDENVGIAVLSNNAMARADALARSVADVVLEDRMNPVPEVTPAVPESEEVAFDSTSFDLFAGSYELVVRPGFILTFTREGNTYYQQATGQPRIEIFPSSDSTFFFKVVEASVTFHRNGDLPVERITLHQGGDYDAMRKKPAPLSPEILSEYVGTYYSPELDATYTLVAEDGSLKATHQRREPFELTRTDPDTFSGPWYFSRAVFERNDEGVVTGVRVSNGRVRNMLFIRQDRPF